MRMKYSSVPMLSILFAVLIISVPVFAQNIDQAQSEYEEFVKQINDVTKQMSRIQAGEQDKYDGLKAEFDRLTKEIAARQMIMESDQETDLKVSEIKKLYNDGLNSFNIQRFNDALAKFKNAISQGNSLGSPLVNDAVKRSYYGLARVYYNQGNYSSMIEPLQSIIKIDPTFYGAMNLMGKSYERQGMNNEAIVAYNKSIMINDSNNNFLAYFNMGTVYLSKKDYRNAKSQFNEALSRNPNHSNAYLYLGRTYFELKDYSNARNALSKSIDIKTDSYQPHFYLAQLFNKTGRYRDAIESANSAMKYHRRKIKFGGALIERGKAYASLGNNARALEDFTTATSDRQYKRNADYEIEILTKFGGKGGQ